MADHHVARPGISPPQGQGGAAGRGNVVSRDVLLEFIVGRRSPPVGQVFPGIALQQKPEHAPPIIHRFRRFGRDHQALGRGGIAGRRQLGLALDADQTDPAIGHVGQLGIPAQGRNIDPSGPGGVENRRAWLEPDGGAVQCEAGHWCFESTALWSCGASSSGGGLFGGRLGERSGQQHPGRRAALPPSPAGIETQGHFFPIGIERKPGFRGHRSNP